MASEITFESSDPAAFDKWLEALVGVKGEWVSVGVELQRVGQWVPAEGKAKGHDAVVIKGRVCVVWAGDDRMLYLTPPTVEVLSVVHSQDVKPIEEELRDFGGSDPPNHIADVGKMVPGLFGPVPEVDESVPF